jgi:hypothetical protein
MSRGGTDPSEGDLILRPEMIVRELEPFGPLTVLVVDDFQLRNRCYLDYCQGGNSMAYSNWKGLKPRTIILAKSVEPEWDYIRLHESREYNKIDREGWSYERAHRYANKGEKEARDNPSRLKALLDTELAILHSPRRGGIINQSPPKP